MRRLSSGIAFIALAAFLPLCASAENGKFIPGESTPPPTIAVITEELTPTALPEVTPTRPQPPLKDSVYQLDADMAEASFKLNPSRGNRDTLIYAYERLVEVLCMPRIHQTLAYTGSPSDPSCLDYLARLKGVNGTNAVVTCVEGGIDSAPCRAQYQEQQVSTFPQTSDGKGSAAAVELQAALSDSNAANEIARIRTEISKSQNSDKTAIAGLWATAITAACRITSLTLAPLTPAMIAQRESAKKKNAADQAMEEALNALESSRQAAKPTPITVRGAEDIIDRRSARLATPVAVEEASVRTRLLSRSCKQVLDAALRFDRWMPRAVCEYNGAYSPACIDALREVRAKEAPASSSSSSQGLASF